MSWSQPTVGVAVCRVRAVASAWALALASALVLCVSLPGDAVGAEPAGVDEEAPTNEPGDPGAGEGAGPGPEPEAGAAEPGVGAEPGPGEVPDAGAEPDAGEVADAGTAAGVVAEPTGTEGSGSTESGASAGPTAGALPSGHAKTDDGPVDEAQRDEDRRAGRRLRGRERDEGHWQVFAPYPELGPIRYRDPESRRTLWLGLDASGTVLPSSLGLSDQMTRAVRPAGAWAFALTPWLALGGRHDVAWYEAGDRSLRVHGHQVELSSRPLAASRSTDALDDRLAFGVTTHAIRWSTSGDAAGVGDTILHLGYGLDHLLGTRWRLGWQAQARYAWVPEDIQRQVRVSARVAFNPRPAHRLSLDAVGYYVNRDDPQGTEPLPRHSVLGQFGLGYAWVGRAGVGPWTNIRATTHFLSGEAPVYELRDEALEAGYGEVLVGMLARWP